MSNISCKKNQEDTIDCLVERVRVHIDHTVNAQDPKTINFEITYLGEYKIDNSIKWDFGDGHVETGDTTVNHTYSGPGTFHANAEVTIRNGDAWCTYELEETVTIN